MRTWISVALFVGLASTPLLGSAAQVKGLELGQPYSNQQLARLFPGSKCFPHGRTGLTYCVLPTTFLGRTTSAEVMRDKKQRIIDFTSYLPVTDEQGVLEILTERFGKPQEVRRGNAVSHVWPAAQGGDLRLEVAVINNQLRINFYSANIPEPQSLPLQANDL